jgi:sec-independent protein translocase protein TatA
MSIGEILVILLVAVLVFGGRLPDAARKLGHVISEFKRGMREEMRRVEQELRPEEPAQEWRRPPPAPPAAPGPKPDPGS